MSIASPQSDPHFPTPLPPVRPPLRHGQRMTVEEWLNLPEDGPECWVSGGILHLAGGGEEEDVTWRNPRHCVTAGRIVYWLNRWLYEQPKPRGEVLVGDAAFQISERAGAGIDAAYVGPELAATLAEVPQAIPGIPQLAVEVLSPYDRQVEITDKIGGYLAAGVAHVWIVDPAVKTVTVYRADRVPKLFTVEDVIDAEPNLRGFRAPVREFFLDS
jgi:Uma2 family endonuclease